EAAVPAANRVYLEAFRMHAERCKAVGERVSSLLPCLESDPASVRLVSALAVLDIGANLVSTGTSAKSLQPAFRAISTADVCWALCSEKRHLIIEQMLPNLQAGGKWSWPELRRTGLAWWLGGAGTQEQLDALVTKFAQHSLARLRAPSAIWSHKVSGTDTEASQREVWGSAPSEDPCVARLLAIDEAVFWSVLLGAKIPKLRALLKTGLLKEAYQPGRSGPGSGGLAGLLMHEHIGEVTFLRKNAFKLLTLHRFHLAAALFLLGECYDEAARVLAGHLRDLQLVLLVSRRCPEVGKTLLRDRLEETSADDPWLSLLLAWHAGDLDLARKCVAEVRICTREIVKREKGGSAPDILLRPSVRPNAVASKETVSKVGALGSWAHPESLQLLSFGLDLPWIADFKRSLLTSNVDSQPSGDNWFGVMSFKLHYAQPTLCYLILAACLVAVMCVAFTALGNRTRLFSSASEREPSWLIFIAACLFFALISGFTFGQENYTAYS
ncbi:unnamed protein product, partial [Polarella glacialis]